MKKKLLVLLLIITVAAFLFTGCTPRPEPEPEPEPGPTIDGVLVEFANEYREGDRIYVKGGKNNVTVTFPAPVPAGTMVQVELSDCTGDYSKGGVYLWPSEDRTVWTGSVKFVCESFDLCEGPCETTPEACCATTVKITSGACEEDTCIAFPVIVDCENPYAELKVAAKDCCCSECAISIKSVADPEEDECAVCPPDLAPCCGDDCSGLASWKVDVYRVKKSAYSNFPEGLDLLAFEDCCEISTCAKLVTSCEGEDCPIECTLDCLELEVDNVLDPVDGHKTYTDEYFYFAIVTLKDNVGNARNYFAAIEVRYAYNSTKAKYVCEVIVREGCCTDDGIEWRSAHGDDSNLIGACKGKCGDTGFEWVCCSDAT